MSGIFACDVSQKLHVHIDEDCGGWRFSVSMNEDRWSTLSGSPFREKKRPFRGVWDNRHLRIGVQNDSEAQRVCVGELIDETHAAGVGRVRLLLGRAV